MTLTQITEKGIKDGEIINADINASAAIAGTKVSPNFGSQNVATTGHLSTKDIFLTDPDPTIFFTDSDGSQNYIVQVNSGIWKVTDSTNSKDRLVIDSSGTVLIGHGVTSRAVANVTAIQQIEGTTGTSSLSITRNSAGSAATCPRISLGRTRGTSVGAVTAVAEDDIIGEIRFSGSDGNDLTNHAVSISALVDGSVANNTVPGRLEFKTATGSDPTTKMTIDSDGRVLIGTATEGHASADDLTINNSGNGGITIRTGNTSNGAIFFSDATSGAAEYDGYVQYNHSDTDPFMQFGVKQATQLVITDGKTGIGTTNPKRHLHIHETASATVGMMLTNGATGQSNDSQGFQFKVAADGTANIEQREDANLVFSMEGNTAMTIDTSRRVRIGTGDIGTAAADNLTITDSGHCGITIRSGDNDAGAIYFGDDDTSDSAHDYRSIILYDHINEGLKFYVNGNTVNHQLEIKSNKDLSIVDGNLVVANGHGIDFSATANASQGSAANHNELLDDYEEGTWTPGVDKSSSSMSGVSYTNTSGTYTKVGRMVTVWFDITVTGGGTSGSGTPYITQLPFVALYGSGSGNNNGGYGAPQFRDMTLTHGDMRIYGNSSYIANSQIYLQHFNSSGTTTASSINGSGRITGQGTYFTT